MSQIEIAKTLSKGRGYSYLLPIVVIWKVSDARGPLSEVDRQEIASSIPRSVSGTNMHIDQMNCHVTERDVVLHLKMRPQANIADIVKLIKGASSRWYYLSHPDRKGNLWEPAYMATVDDERAEELINEYRESMR